MIWLRFLLFGERNSASVRYDREVLTNVLIYHAHCGWASLGASYADHIADIYEQSVVARSGQPDEEPLT